MKIGILGATGQAGQRLARFLAREGEHHLVLLGRNETKLNWLRAQTEKETRFPLSCRVVDLASLDNLRAAFAPLDLVLIALSDARHLPLIVQAAIDTKTDLYDILLSSPDKIALLQTRAQQLTDAGVCYITDGGYHPGVPAALVRYAYARLPHVTRAEVFVSFGLDWASLALSQETIIDFVRELKSMDMSAFVAGRWINNFSNAKHFTFPAPIGKKNCIAMGMEEMKSLPAQIPPLKDTGFYIAGFGPVMDWLVMPLSLLALKLAPRSLPRIANLFARALCRYASGRNWAELHLVAQDHHRTLRLRLSHNDAYDLTALPVIACLRRMSATPHRAGLWLQAHFVEPISFIEDLKSLGVEVEETIAPRAD